MFVCYGIPSRENLRSVRTKSGAGEVGSVYRVYSMVTVLVFRGKHSEGLDMATHCTTVSLSWVREMLERKS